MAENTVRSSEALASEAARVLRDPNASELEKRLAGSVLSNYRK